MPKLTKKQREEYRADLLAEHPRLEAYFVDMLLQVYDDAPGYVEQLAKEHIKDKRKHGLQGEQRVLNSPKVRSARCHHRAVRRRLRLAAARREW